MIALPPPGTEEVLLAEAGRPVLVRVALEHGLPGWADERMHLGGTWCYLVADGPGVLVCDTSMQYPGLWCLLPLACPKALVAPLPVVDRITAALDRYFPGQSVTAIALTHWHPDHTEAAPALQAALGGHPPLRIAALDRPARGNGVLAGGADAVFHAAGYRSWTWGPDLRNGEPLGRTGFRVLALPGHTRGNVAFVDAARKLSLGPPARYEPPRYNPLTEQPLRHRDTMIAFYQATYGYRHFASHPARDVLDAWPEQPWEPPTKRGPAGYTAPAP
ncbi:MAG: fold metallo-hydrolase [Cyanobacteria bacterium RYN_339]|nr:fold metallo-hydrolase [Cyanobacteria bacterium RYN_339]